MQNMNDATVTLLDMLHDAYQGGINPKTDKPRSSLTKRVLYSAVRRKLEPQDFEMVMEEIVARGKATVTGNSYRWIQH